MKKWFLLIMIVIMTCSQVFAYAVKVYDQWGNRIGTYRKEGENFVLYDFYDKRIENPEDLILNAPSQKTLKEYSQYLYDENMNPIGMYSTEPWHNNFRYYPRGRYAPRNFHHPSPPYIVRPPARGNPYLNQHYHHSGSFNIIKTK